MRTKTNERTPQPGQVPPDLCKDRFTTGPQLTEDRRASGAKEILCGCRLEETVGTESSLSLCSISYRFFL